MEKQMIVHASPLPFSNRQVRLTLHQGKTVAEIVTEVCAIEGVGAIVTINGHDIPREHWHRVRPKPNTVINVRIVPQGGGGGGKSPIVTLLSIAIMVAAPYAGVALSNAAWGAGLITGGITQAITVGRVLTMGIGAIGLLALNALAPPPKSSNLGRVSNPAESQTQFIEGANNAIRPYGVVPVCLGTNRMFPAQAARPFTETENNDQYVRQLFTYGYGSQLVCTDFKIGETAISEFSDIQMEHRLNGDLHLSTSLYSNDFLQDNYNILLQQVDGFTTRTTQIGVDEVIIDVTFPQGLAQFNSQGARGSRTVQVEVQYALSGSSPLVWSPAISYTAVSGISVDINDFPVVMYRGRVQDYVGYRRDVMVINSISGAISRVKGTSVADNPNSAAAPGISPEFIRLATILVKTQRVGSVTTTTVESIVDNRQPSLFGTRFQNSTDFAATNVGTTVSVAAGNLSNPGIQVTGSQTEALRRSLRIIFPQNGTYDIRLRRITDDSSDDQVFDEVYLTAIKSIKHQAPVRLTGINGTAVRIKGTDQLNGAIEQFNCVVSNVIPDYNPATGEWEDRITSNPASIYLYVLRGAANSKPVTDSQIDFDALEEWHTYCTEQGYSYNRVIDYETSVSEVLRDVAAAGAASPTVLDGRRSVVVDRVKEDIVQVITPRNSWGYSGRLVYPDLPHAFRVQFRNAGKGYQIDERIVYDDGYHEFNATKFETLELLSCTNTELAHKTGRRHIASVRLRPETHTFMMDVESLVAVRGNRIKFAHDVPIIGVGDGRVKEIQYSGESPNTIEGFTIDDVVTIPNNGAYYVRLRRGDGTLLYKQVLTSIGTMSQFTFVDPLALAEEFEVGDLCYFVESGGELDLIITRIEPGPELTAKITAVDYAPEVFTAENSPIPNWTSNVTTPLELLRPESPILLDAQSDESVSTRQSDGSILNRAVFTLRNNNKGEVQPTVRIRRTGTDSWSNANVLESSPQRVVITGLEDNRRYDIHIRYQRPGGVAPSAPLQINNYQFRGGSTPPDDVTGFVVSISGETAMFKWDVNENIDFDHYILKYSNAYSGATYEAAQGLEDQIYENRISVPFIGGTYFVKAVDRQGNESENAAVIITYNPGQLHNAIATITENPDFAGVKDNVQSYVDGIILGDPLQDGYYYFEETFSLDGFFDCLISATVTSGAIYVNDIFDFSDIFAEEDIFGAEKNDIFSMDNIFANDDLFGIGTGAWDLQLQYRKSDIDSTGSPDGFGEWQEFKAGYLGFHDIQFRLRLRSFLPNVSPYVTGLSVSIDMPDRIERGEDVTVPAAGLDVVFSPAFREAPAVNVTIQSGDGDDEVRLTSKTNSGFNLRIYNKASATFVERVVDYIASGYGRLN